MAFTLIRPGSILAPSTTRRMLSSPLPAAPTGGINFAGPYPSAIVRLTGWWDAGGLAGIRDLNKNPLAAWNNPASSLADLSGHNINLIPFHNAANTSPPQTLAVSRLNNVRGGLGSPNTVIAQYAPSLDPDWGLLHPALSLGSATAWTIYLVWTRPNFRQGTIQVNQNPIALIRSVMGGMTILQADSAGGTNLTLYPGTASATPLSTSLARRHSHALILRHIPGSGVDAWLDGQPVATGIINPLSSISNDQTLLLHDTSIQGSAQCWFHEAACWGHDLSAPDIATLVACQSRWVLGPRKGVNLLVMGQSNAEWFTQSGGALALAQGISWYLGAAAWGFTAQQSGNFNTPARYSMVSGHPISNSTPPLFPPGLGNGTFLTNPGDGSDPSTWSFGPDGAALSAYLQGSSALVSLADESDFAALVWPWTEQDSTLPYASKSLYKASVLRLLQLSRSVLGRSAASLPLLVWNAIPYETNEGVQMVRESMFDLASDPANNIVIFAPQTADSNPLNAIWAPATGLFSGGDPQHRDQPDLLRFGRNGSHAAARAALANGRSDTIAAADVPANQLPIKGGPAISHAFRASNTNIIITITHDSGTDLIVPLQAANGVGWAFMDGGSIATPGPLITALSASRIDATHISLTLSAPLTQPSAFVLIFYPYGSTQIGRGDAITDNAASQTPPEGWDIGADLGAAWRSNFPLQASFYPVTLSDLPI
jgi:hypothetical protein